MRRFTADNLYVRLLEEPDLLRTQVHSEPALELLLEVASTRNPEEQLIVTYMKRRGSELWTNLQATRASSTVGRSPIPHYCVAVHSLFS